MKRRDFLCSAAGAVISPTITLGSDDSKIKNFGWIPGHTEASVFTEYPGLGKGKVACLWEPWEKIHGPWRAHKQEWMDCVAQATGGGLDLLTAIENHKFIAAASTDMIYAGGRNHIAKRVVGPGMMGSWAVDWLQRYGKLLRQDYGRYDLTHYSKQTCKYWDRKGVPRSLGQIAKRTPLLSYKSVETWNQCRDAIASGHPILFCSFLGVEDSVRDEDGFIVPRGKWAHAWLLAGIDDRKIRPGACLINSHGEEWASGPKRHNNPDGSVWVDKEHIINNFYDCYALCSVQDDKPIPAPPPRRRRLFPWLK